MLLALLCALFSLALPGRAQASGEGVPAFTPGSGAAALTPLLASSEEPVETEPATAVTQTSATLNATVDPNGGTVTECKFEYGTTTSYGSSAACTPSGLTGPNPVPVTAPVTGLTTNTTYHLRITAASVSGATTTISQGLDVTLVTLGPAPTVTAVEPSTGTTLGGTAVKIKGTGFVAGATVKIGSAATAVEVVSETEIKAVTAATAAGADEVVVSDANGTSTAGQKYTYNAPPTVTTIEPSSGTTLGGTAVTIKGTGFVTPATVKIGNATTSAIVVSPTEITATTAATAAGADEVIVTDANGTSTGGPKYTYMAPPTVTSIEPNSGSTAGGTAVKIKGTGFVAGATVKIGSAATSVEVVPGTETEIKAVTPPGAPGQQQVVVTDANGTSTGAIKYTYLTAPTVMSITPSAGPTSGGTTVTIHGSGFLEGPEVKFGSNVATIDTVNSEGTSITATSPPGAGTVNVTVTSSGSKVVSATSAADEFTYLPVPAVTGVSPAGGSAAGGSAVTITGAGFAQGAEVRFGSAAAGAVVVTSQTSLTATSPAGTGTVHIAVTTAGGTSSTSSADEFTYTTPPSTGGGGGTSTAPVTKPPTTPAGLPAPVLTRTANVASVAGRVLIRLPGARAFVALSSARQIPYGTVIEATHGEVSVTAATLGSGTQRGEFFDGEFVLSQGSNGRVLATLTGGNFSVCRPQAGAARAKPKARSKYAASTHLVRRLWSEARGNFSTKGRYAGGVVQGAQWLTEDMCEGTLILATREHVEVTDLVHHRHAVVATGGIYLVKSH